MGRRPPARASCWSTRPTANGWACTDEMWPRLGDLFKQKYKGYKAVVLAGGEDMGKNIGLKPRRRWPVKNGPLDAKILVFDLY